MNLNAWIEWYKKEQILGIWHRNDYVSTEEDALIEYEIIILRARFARIRNDFRFRKFQEVLDDTS